MNPNDPPHRSDRLTSRLSSDGTVRSWPDPIAEWSEVPTQAAVGRPLCDFVQLLGEDTQALPLRLSLAKDFSELITLGRDRERAPRGACARFAFGATGIELELSPLGACQSALTRTPHGDALSSALVAKLRTSPADVLAQRLGVVLGNIPGFCYIVDEDLVFLSSLGAGLAHLQLTDDQLVGSRLCELWGTTDPCYEPFVCHLRALAGQPQKYQDVCLGRSLEYQLRPLRGEDGRVVGVIGVGMDVTERVQAAAREERLTAQLRHAQKLEDIGRLSGGIAHDFNNLLTSLMGQLALAEEAAQGNREATAYLTECNRTVDSAASLTRQLLAFSRKQVIQPLPLDLTELVRKTKNLLSRLIGDQIRLTIDAQDDLWLVKADPNQLEQVLVNLVVNARDAMSKRGEVTLRTHNQAWSDSLAASSPSLRQGDYVVLTVEDSGRGMSEAVLARLFEPFFTTKPSGEGTGLGLAMVAGAAAQNGGGVAVDSRVGEGSRFSVFLPRFEGELAPVMEFPLTERGTRGGSETILLVEDEPLVLDLAQVALSELGYRVLPCGGADEALRKLTEYPDKIHLLLTDVMMPRMNGKELAARATSLRPEIAVLYCSGYGESVIARQGVLDQGLHFIAKPYRPSELARRAREVLDLATAESALG